MSVQHAPAPSAVSYGEFKPYHIFCRCTLSAALCGAPPRNPRRELLTARPALVCHVCDDLDALPCPRCGGRPA